VLLPPHAPRSKTTVASDPPRIHLLRSARSGSSRRFTSARNASNATAIKASAADIAYDAGARKGAGGRVNKVLCDGTLTLSLELTALAAAVTIAGESAQVGTGVLVPVTLQVKLIAPENPFWPANMITSVTTPPPLLNRDIEDGVTLKVGAGAMLAVTV